MATVEEYRGGPYSPGYPKGYVPISVAAIPFSRRPGAGETIEAMAGPYYLDDSRRHNGEPIPRREPSPAPPPGTRKPESPTKMVDSGKMGG